MSMHVKCDSRKGQDIQRVAYNLSRTLSQQLYLLSSHRTVETALGVIFDPVMPSLVIIIFAV